MLTENATIMTDNVTFINWSMYILIIWPMYNSWPKRIYTTRVLNIIQETKKQYDELDLDHSNTLNPTIFNI